ncbi:hypothetical protein [Desulfotomaculum copahuensis]|uniref:Uncharacterized protein n=1 Tax=Desulfotomaculum copahuensis TaxID=1838280 RepID=A0A1B7LHS8_9FIRM|nr:hypothetical protein [Desulfotomaculum copahuensis]OAT85845.1 hypothetical protein A6M21_05040 [Desulfotomaculum copahuensis]
MQEQDFIEVFKKQKEAFLKDCEAGRRTWPPGGSRAAGEQKKVLDWFERWLKGEAVPETEEESAIPVKSFGEFMDEVLVMTREILEKRNIKMIYALPGQYLGISESWKCIQVFGNRNIYYRIGRTRPRKGTRRGEDLLVLDLVMDGYKKQVFLPVIEQKEHLEKLLGETLERELPKVEATGKYRLKVALPYKIAQQGNAPLVAKKLADFITVTKPVLNDLGIV